MQTQILDQLSVRSLLPDRDPWGHKGTFGKVLLLCGSRGFTGAAYVRITTDVDLLKEISDELGQYCYEGDLNTTEVLLDASWEFTFSFRPETAEEASRELLTIPVVTKGQVYKRYGDGDGEYEYVLDDITITSVKLNALSATITYEFTGLYPAFEWDGNHVFAVMNDGTEIMLEDNWSRWDGYNVLKARSPIVVDEVDHIRLADGTKVKVQ